MASGLIGTPTPNAPLLIRACNVPRITSHAEVVALVYGAPAGMVQLSPAQLTPSGRPQLGAGEVEKALLDKVTGMQWVKDRNGCRL